MSGMSPVDWAIVAAYLLLALGAGLWLRKRASQDLDSYFVAGRKLSGWLVGTSMVATTFAADTPLAVTGLVAQHGIAGNWFWWSFAFSHIAAAFVFARMWRRAEIITDAEIIEVRYSGRSAAALRLLRAFYFAIPINCITMAWVIRAMGKIVAVLFPWDQWLDPRIYAWLLHHWPAWMAISSPSEAISILIGVCIAVTYAALGGLPSVIFTDVVQFGLAMFGAVALAVLAVSAVGGLEALPVRLEEIYGTVGAQGITAMFPQSDAAWLPLEAFLVFVCVQWWAWKYSDGGGILVQRMSAAKDEIHALRGTSWFVLAHYALRPWPWILVGLAALVLYPLHGEPAGDLARAIAGDREMAYPVLMAQLLPPGLLGIMVAGMTAAFMSTVDTHVNWGASYLVRDVYQRFLRPQATQKQLVRASRISVFVILILALAITTQIHSIAGAWKFITAMSAGLGLVTVLRWFWWRINAYSEIAGLVSAAVLSLYIYIRFGGDDAAYVIPYHEVLLVIVGFSTAVIVVVTLLTQPTSIHQLREFYARVRPLGFWKPVSGDASLVPKGLLPMLLAWLCASVGLFGVLFGLGEWLLGSTFQGTLMVLLGGMLWLLALYLAGAFRQVGVKEGELPAQPRSREKNETHLA